MCHLGLFVPMKKLCQVGLTKTKWILNLPSLYGVLASETEWLATDSSPKSTSEILVYFWRPQPPGPRSSFASSSRTWRATCRLWRHRTNRTWTRCLIHKFSNEMAINYISISMTRWLNKKLPNYPQKIALKVVTRFLYYSDIFKNSPKSYQNIWATFVRQFVAKNL